MRATGMLPFLLGVAAAACGATPWKFVCYDGFVESVDRLVGQGAIDCGFVDLASRVVSRTERARIAGCVTAALAGQRPFKYGVVPADSTVFHALLRAADGELWTVRYARDISNGHMHETQFNQKCRHMSFDPGALIFSGVDCTLVSTEGLPTYDPHTGH